MAYPANLCAQLRPVVKEHLSLMSRAWLKHTGAALSNNDTLSAFKLDPTFEITRVAPRSVLEAKALALQMSLSACLCGDLCDCSVVRDSLTFAWIQIKEPLWIFR